MANPFKTDSQIEAEQQFMEQPPLENRRRRSMIRDDLPRLGRARSPEVRALSIELFKMRRLASVQARAISQLRDELSALQKQVNRQPVVANLDEISIDNARSLRTLFGLQPVPDDASGDPIQELEGMLAESDVQADLPETPCVPGGVKG